MSAATAAQIAANASNAQRGRGPVTEAGKAISSINRLTHGLAGGFRVLPWESQTEFETLLAALRDEYNPQTATEQILVQKAAEHQWIGVRAGRLQESTLPEDPSEQPDSAMLGLYLRYQTTHERAFQRCIRELRAIGKDRQREQFGFESQKRAQAQETRRENDEVRRRQMHDARLHAIDAQTQGRQIGNDIRQTVEAPLPGHMRLPFDTMKDAFRLAVHQVNRDLAANSQTT